MFRFVVLAINSFNHIENKTGNMLIRYRQDEVVAVIDPEKKGLTSKIDVSPYKIMAHP